MQHISYTSILDTDDVEREMSEFNEDFKGMFGHYPGQSGQNSKEETDEQKQARLASYNIGIASQQ